MYEIELWSLPYKELVSNEENIIQKTEITEFQASFLCGAIRKSKPKKIVEVGTSAGGSTCIIMNALNMLEWTKTEVHSVDLSKYYYKNKSMKTGYLADEYSKRMEFCNFYQYTGCMVADVIEKIGGGIDLLYLDAAHVSPGEILDFLVCYPFLTRNATVILHDVSLMHKHKNIGFDITANAMLYASVVADKILNLDNKAYTGNYPNIGGFQCTEDTKNYIENVFLSLFTKWHYLLTDAQDASVRKILSANYSKELLDLYIMAVDLNKHSYAEKDNNKFKDIIKKLLYK